MRCRWGDGRGNSGEGNEVTAGQMGVAGSREPGDKSEGLWWTGGESKGPVEVGMSLEEGTEIQTVAGYK